MQESDVTIIQIFRYYNEYSLALSSYLLVDSVVYSFDLDGLHDIECLMLLEDSLVKRRIAKYGWKERSYLEILGLIDSIEFNKFHAGKAFDSRIIELQEKN